MKPQSLPVVLFVRGYVRGCGLRQPGNCCRNILVTQWEVDRSGHWPIPRQ